MMSEILNCIKLIKMYAWEKSFAKAISGMFMLVMYPMCLTAVACAGTWVVTVSAAFLVTAAEFQTTYFSNGANCSSCFKGRPS